VIDPLTDFINQSGVTPIGCTRTPPLILLIDQGLHPSDALAHLCRIIGKAYWPKIAHSKKRLKCLKYTPQDKHVTKPLHLGERKGSGVHDIGRQRLTKDAQEAWALVTPSPTKRSPMMTSRISRQALTYRAIGLYALSELSVSSSTWGCIGRSQFGITHGSCSNTKRRRAPPLHEEEDGRMSP